MSTVPSITLVAFILVELTLVIVAAVLATLINPLKLPPLKVAFLSVIVVILDVPVIYVEPYTDKLVVSNNAALSVLDNLFDILEIYQ